MVYAAHNGVELQRKRQQLCGKRPPHVVTPDDARECPLVSYLRLFPPLPPSIGVLFVSLPAPVP
eukprot:5610915-Lingulodinium_polyedra.AAC.1